MRIGRYRVPLHVWAFAALVLANVWWLWGTVARPDAALARLDAKNGCPRPPPARVSAPPWLSAHERCVLVWSAFRFPAYAGIPAESSRLDSVTIVVDEVDAGVRLPISRSVWEVALWMRRDAGPHRVWWVSVDQHDGEMDLLEPGAVDMAKMRKKLGAAAPE